MRPHFAYTLAMADPLVPRPIDLCLVADAVLELARTGKWTANHSKRDVIEAGAFLARLGFHDAIQVIVDKYQERKGGGTP